VETGRGVCLQRFSRPYGTFYKGDSLADTMPRRRARAPREPRGAQKWILNEFGSESPGRRLSTSQITQRIERASKKSFHKNSIYKALRLLVNRRALEVARSGREKLYRLLGPIRSAGSRAVTSVKSAARGRGSGARALGAGRPIVDRLATDARAAAAMLPHKLGLGEILVLSVGAREVLTATNLHGRLVLERHPVPA
jgi:hypothetical protein